MANFQIHALEKNDIEGLFSLPGFPCRISLTDAAEGERILALHHLHHDVTTPYRASGPIFIRENVETAHLPVNEVPTLMLHRQMSVRGYDATGMIVDASVVIGSDLSAELARLFDNEKVDYVHIHHAIPGCFACRVTRANSN